MKINEKIKHLREGKHWSQEEMAQKLNMSKNGYAKIERGETSASLGRLEQVIAALRHEIEWLNEKIARLQSCDRPKSSLHSDIFLKDNVL